MRATGVAPWILIGSCFAGGPAPAHALGEFFRGAVMTTQRFRAVDSSSLATLFTGFDTVAHNSVIEGNHLLLDDGNFRAAGGPWIGITEYVGYIRAPSQAGRCYRSTLDAFYPPDVVGIWVSSLVCIHAHSPECGHCGLGPGNACEQGVDEEKE